MNDIIEQTNAEVSITLDDVEKDTPVSVFFFEQYGKNKDNRIEVANYAAPLKGQAKAAILDTYDIDLAGASKKTYKVEIWSNIDTANQQLEHTDTVNIVDARAV